MFLIERVLTGQISIRSIGIFVLFNFVLVLVITRDLRALATLAGAMLVFLFPQEDKSANLDESKLYSDQEILKMVEELATLRERVLKLEESKELEKKIVVLQDRLKNINSYMSINENKPRIGHNEIKALPENDTQELESEDQMFDKQEIEIEEDDNV